MDQTLSGTGSFDKILVFPNYSLRYIMVMAFFFFYIATLEVNPQKGKAVPFETIIQLYCIVTVNRI